MHPGIEREQQQTAETRARAYTFRGYAYYTKRDYDRAIANYDEAVALNPNYALAYSQRGIAYGMKTGWDSAIRDWTKAIELNGNDADSYRLRGDAYQRKGNNKQAIADYCKALEIRPPHEAAKTGLRQLGAEC